MKENTKYHGEGICANCVFLKFSGRLLPLDKTENGDYISSSTETTKTTTKNMKGQFSDNGIRQWKQ